MNKVEESVSLFEQGFSCSQAILSTYGPGLGMDRDIALKSAEGFVGGIACLGHTCGAVVGAIMVIGLKYGRTEAKDRKSQAKTVKTVRRFLKGFEERQGTTMCRELLGCSIDTPVKEKAAQVRGLFSDVCPRAVRDAAEVLEEILNEGDKAGGR
jgi:C_GCAxxG_C_C family probable redox protein